MSWPDDLLRAWRADHRRWLLLASCCAPDADLARSSWESLCDRFDDADAMLKWLATGPPRRALPFLGSRAEQLELDDVVRNASADAVAEAWALNQSVFITARSVVTALADADMDVMALKGLALAGDVYRPHRLRAVGDLDLLVRPAHHRRAVELLETQGWRREPGDSVPRPGTAAVMLSRPGSATLDLHSRPARNLPFRIGQDPQCWSDTRPVGEHHPVADTPLLLPSTESMLVIQASHAVLGANTSLVHPLLDVCQILTASADGRCPPLDVDQLLAIADSNGALGRLRAVLKLVVGELGMPGPTDVPIEPRRARRREVRVHRADRRVSNRDSGLTAAFGRAIGYVRVCTVGQGPATTAQMTWTVLASKVARLRRTETALPEFPAAEPAFSTSGSGSIFGIAEDGSVVEIRWSHPDMVEEILSLWPPLGLEELSSPPLDPTLVIELIGDVRAPIVIVDGDVQPDSWDAIESALALFTAEHLTHEIAVHAALFVLDGRAIMVPGSSHAGKSTLAIAAHEVGAIVASDEYALIDPRTGDVRGWNRPVRRRTPEGVEKLDIAQDITPMPVSVVAAVRYTTGKPELHELTQAETAIEILANTVCAQLRPEDATMAATAVARSARGVGGTRGGEAELLRRTGLTSAPSTLM